jgi:sec-independent protein translocase protein TatA
MGAFSIWHWIIVLIIVLLLFGKGKIPSLMADMAKGIKSFKKNMSDDDNSDSSSQDNQNKDQYCFL